MNEEYEVSLIDVSAYMPFPSRRTWGEAWWTSRDICLTNAPEFEDPIQTIVNEYDRKLWKAFIHGPDG